MTTLRIVEAGAVLAIGLCAMTAASACGSRTSLFDGLLGQEIQPRADAAGPSQDSGLRRRDGSVVVTPIESGVSLPPTDGGIIVGAPDAGPPPHDATFPNDVANGATLVCGLGDLVCNGACVDPTTDPSHCGGCNLSCTGECTGGRCLVVLASNQAGPTHVLVDSTDVYWLDEDDPTAVVKVPIGGGVPTTLGTSTDVPGQLSLEGLALDAAGVYWCGYVDGTILESPLAGGAPITLSAGPSFQSYPNAIAVNGGGIYWVDYNNGMGGTLMTMPRAGGAVTTLASLPGVLGELEVDDTNVYLELLPPQPQAESQMLSVPLGGGTVTTLAATPEFPQLMALDATHVYWAAGGNGGVLSVPVTGGAVTTLAPDQYGTEAVAVDATYVYWTNFSAGTVAKSPLAGGAAVTLATGQTEAYGLAVDGTSVYWATNPDMSHGMIMKLTPK